jgi:hypothetical protein
MLVYMLVCMLPVVYTLVYMLVYMLLVYMLDKGEQSSCRLRKAKDLRTLVDGRDD